MPRLRLLPILAVIFSFALAPAAHAQTQINSGAPGDVCQTDDGGIAYTAPDAGVQVNGLGASAPAYNEVGDPTGAFAGKPPKGVMLVVNGGGWHTVGQGAVAADRGIADGWRNRGWETVNLTYRGCDHTLDDVMTQFDIAHGMWPALPICASGASAGGQLALMLAARRPELSCVEAKAAPTDLTGILTESASGGNSGPTKVYWWAAGAMGAVNLALNSPLAQAALIHARVFQADASDDPLIPMRQATDLDALLLGYSDTMVLDPGTTPFVHGSVASESKADMFRREDNLVAPLTGDAPGECDLCGAGAGWSRTATTPPVGSLAQITMSNDVIVNGAKAGVLKPVLTLNATGGSWVIPATPVTVPAGKIRLETCWGAGGGTVTTFTTCTSKDVTTTATSTQSAPAKTVGIARTATPYWWTAAINVSQYVNGAWKPIGSAWHNTWGSRVTVPALGVTTF